MLRGGPQEARPYGGDGQYHLAALGGAALRYNDAEELTRLIDGFDAEAHRARAREYERLYDAAGPEAVMFAFVKAFQPDRPAKC